MPLLRPSARGLWRAYYLTDGTPVALQSIPDAEGLIEVNTVLGCIFLTEQGADKVQEQLREAPDLLPVLDRRTDIAPPEPGITERPITDRAYLARAAERAKEHQDRERARARHRAASIEAALNAPPLRLTHEERVRQDAERLQRRFGAEE
jgi:hypothetical protein